MHAPTVVSSRSVGFKRHRAPFTLNAHGLNATAMGVGQRYGLPNWPAACHPCFDLSWRECDPVRVQPGDQTLLPYCSFAETAEPFDAQARQPKRVDTMQWFAR